MVAVTAFFCIAIPFPAVFAQGARVPCMLCLRPFHYSARQRHAIDITEKIFAFSNNGSHPVCRAILSQPLTIPMAKAMGILAS
jgi:hypothetical protein